MTALAQLVWDCRAIQGMDKLVLMGWAEQVPDGSDLAYASKETVAERVGVSDDTVLRRTKELVLGGWLIATGGRKRWTNGWTPVYQVNLELLMGKPRNLRGAADCGRPQIAAQGSRFTGLSGSLGLSSSSSPSFSVSSGSGTGVPPALLLFPPGKREKEVKREEKTENREPRTVEPKPSPTPSHGRRHRTCPDCGETLQRDVNHLLVCKGKSSLDDDLGDMPPRPSLDSMGEQMEFEEWQLNADPLFPGSRGPQAEGARQRVEAERQKEIESILAEGRAPATGVHPWTETQS
jgi:hypothetical protein